MLKSVFIIASLGVLLLLIALSILARFNWGDKFYTPLVGLGVALAGIVASLITIAAMLKGDVFHDEFTTFVVVGTETRLPVFPNQINPDRNSLVYRLGHYCSLASPRFTDQAGKEIVLFDAPQNDKDETLFYEELLQYELVMEIIDMHNPYPWLRMTVGEPGPRVGANKPFKLSDAEKRPLLDICPDISRLRFSNNPVEKETLKSFSSRLPKGTKIALQTDSKEHAVVLTKPHFFTIKLTVEPAHFSGQAGATGNSGITPEVAANSKTLMFEISMVGRFEKLTSGNRLMPELINWTKWMFGRLETRFSDTTPGP